MVAALSAVRAKQPEKLIAALGVSPPDTIRKLKSLADEVVCLEAPTEFYAVGQFFSDFTPVTDEQVIENLQRISRYPKVQIAG